MRSETPRSKLSVRAKSSVDRRQTSKAPFAGGDNRATGVFKLVVLPDRRESSVRKVWLGGNWAREKPRADRCCGPTTTRGSRATFEDLD